MDNPSSPSPVPTPTIDLEEETNSSSTSKRSLVYQYFTYKTSRYYCNHCSKNYSDKSTSTLWRHISNKHQKILAESQNQEGNIGEMDKFVISDQKENFSQKGFRKRVIRWVVNNDQPFNVTENKEFRDMVTFIRPGIHVPSADTLRRDANDNFNAAKYIFKQELQEAPGRLSFTVDAWTSKNQIPFLGISVHWINKKWELKCTTLDFCVLSGSHTGANLSEKFLNTLQDFGVITKILAIECDNASNMDKINAFNALRTAHVINLAAKKLIDCLYVTRIPYENEDIFEAIEDNNDNLKDAIYKLRKIVVKIRASPQLREHFKQQCTAVNIKPLELIPDVSTRWNSTDDMITRALELKQPLHNIVSADKDLRKYILSEEEWQYILDVHEILQYFKKSTNFSTGQQYPTLSCSVPVYNYLLDKLEDEYDKRESEKGEENEVVVALNKSIEKLKQYYASTGALIYTVATVMDPRFKLQYYKDNKWEDSYIQEAKRQVFELWKSTYKGNSADDDESCEDDDELFRHIFKKRKLDKDELSIYLDEKVIPRKTDILACWKAHEVEYPNLSKMARDYLSIPG
ncbi:unnamed protein product [Rhizophagus irregularis]|nr:unnamed protein product [Rhizophagus irregularis]